VDHRGHEDPRLALNSEHPADREAAFVPGHTGLPSLRGEVAFRLLVESVEDYAIFVLSPEGKVLTWNLGAQRIKGYAPDEIIGQHFSRFYTAEERKAGRPMRLLSRAAEQGRVQDEGWRIRKDGTRFWADVIITALRDGDGVPIGFAKVTRDLTERRANEEREQALLVEREARAAAEAALTARDRFLSIASHELKTPAASLALTVEGLARARETGRLDDERLAVGLRRLGVATARLGSLVDELLDVTRLQGERPHAAERLDLSSLVTDVVERFTDADEGHRIRLVAPDQCWIVGDASRLDQVITNLVDNALKYSDTGDAVEVDVTRADGGARLSVSDVGIGLDETAEGFLFEAFGRGANVQHIPGLGLGLYIAHQIVTQHGGRMDARRRSDGPGSVVSVWLPAGGAS
jgi:PAS domain S-box-containing protein